MNAKKKMDAEKIAEEEKKKAVSLTDEGAQKVERAFAIDNLNDPEHAELNQWGYFDSAEDCRTRTEGLFVAGDCRSKRIRQVVTAASDGAVAAMAACMYLDQN